jgi:hypothetical protein
MKLELIGKPFVYRWPGGSVRLEPGKPIDLPPDRAAKLLARAQGRVRPVEGAPSSPVLKAGVWVEWLSPALPAQRGEILAIHPDGTFDVHHPLTEILCHLPVTWITRVLPAPTNSEEANTVNVFLPSYAPPLRISLDDPTPDARAIWELSFPDAPWPPGARVRWVPYMRRFSGLCIGKREVLLSRADLEQDPQEAMDTLLHELVHLRGHGRHDTAFYRVENECRARLGLPPMPDGRAERRARREEKKRRSEAALTEWQQKYGALPMRGDEVILLEANRQFPAGVWGTIISVRGSRVEVRWGVTEFVWYYYHHGLRLIQPTGRKRTVRGRSAVIRKASELVPLPAPREEGEG